MARLQGFWSYVHDDDKADGERITRLAKDVKEQYEMLTGDKIELFVDKNDIRWGAAWRDAIESKLSSVAFFIPIITPRFFNSPACRNELQTFARQAKRLGIKGLVLPLLYVDDINFINEETKDDLVQLIKSLQYVDWTELRFKEVESEDYRRGVFHLVKDLFEANQCSEQETPVEIIQPGEVTERDNDSPGIIDKLANSEQMLSKLPETLDSITQDIKQIGQIMQEATNNIHQSDAQGRGFAARLIIAQRIAKQLSDPVERIWSQSNVYASQIHDVDEGFRILIERAPLEIKENQHTKQKFCSLFKSIQEMSDAAIKSTEGNEKMINASEPLEQLSRDLRPAVRRLKQGLTIMIESTEVSKEWVDLINATGILCEDINT